MKKAGRSGGAAGVIDVCPIARLNFDVFGEVSGKVAGWSQAAVIPRAP